MNFHLTDHYNYSKFIVTVEYYILDDQKEVKKPQTFETLGEALNYIRKVKKDYKKLTDVYKRCEIYFEKIQTKSHKYIVRDDD